MTVSELNEQVARRVFGFGRPFEEGRQITYMGEWPDYATDIREAWKIVEYLRANHWLVTVKHMPEGAPFVLQGARSEYDAPCADQEVGHGKAVCELHCMDRQRPVWRRDVWAFGDTPMVAICRAALRVQRDTDA